MPTDPPAAGAADEERARRRHRGWRARLRRARWFRRGKLWLKRLTGREPWLATDIRANLTHYGDWALSTERLAPGDVVYCMGVGKDLGLELELIHAHGVEVHAFDPSPESLRWVAQQRLPPSLRFHALGVAERDGILRLRARHAESGGAPVMYSVVTEARTGPEVEVECLGLPAIVRRLGHARIGLLKLDVEGAEYGVLRGMLAAGLRPAQLLVEFHHRFPGLGRAETEAAVAALRAAGYRLAFIADTGREFTFLHQD